MTSSVFFEYLNYSSTWRTAVDLKRFVVRSSTKVEERKNETIHSIFLKKMKSKDLQKVVISKYENGESLAKICRDLSGVVSYRTIRRWCKSITNTGSINLSKPPGQIRTARTKGAIQKVKDRLKRKKPYQHENLLSS